MRKRTSSQFGVVCLRQAKLRRRDDVMTEGTQENARTGINILIGEESHGVGARQMFSIATTSIAYWMQARMSSGSRSG